MATKAERDAVFERMKYCPECAEELRLMGSLNSQLKTCDKHGVMHLIGPKQPKVGIIFEVHPEE